MVQTGHHAYRQNAGNSVINKDQLLIKLLDGSLNFLRLARRGMEEKNIKVKGENISKILAIMTELDSALDIEAGGEIAENLSHLYRHIIYRLINANIKNDYKGLDEAENILSNIKEGFVEAIKSNREAAASNQTTNATQPSVELTDHKGGMSFAV